MQMRLWWRLWWSLESGGRFCVGAFGRNLSSVAVKMFSHLIYLRRDVINSVRSMRFAKTAAVNCITVQHKKCSFPSTLTGHTTPVQIQATYVHMSSDIHRFQLQETCSTHPQTFLFSAAMFVILTCNENYDIGATSLRLSGQFSVNFSNLLDILMKASRTGVSLSQGLEHNIHLRLVFEPTITVSE
jgi:hypothetical protein